MTEFIDHRLYRTPLLRFDCEKCGAKVGEECRTASGAVAYDQHHARYLAEADYYRALDA